MIIQRIRLENFRGITAADFDLDNDNVTITGANGTGKTTVANAISWLLTDKAATGEKDFTPKTEGAHNLNHTVEMQLIGEDNGQVTLKKDFHEVWKKKRGSKAPEFSGHETTYEINGVPVKKKEFEEAISLTTGCDSTEKILMLSRAGYFAEDMKADDRRKILFDVCGDMTDDEVMEKAGLQELQQLIIIPGTEDTRYSLDEYMAITKAKRKEINKKLDEIPARIDELTTAIPDELPEQAEKRAAEIISLEASKKDLLTATPDNNTAALKAVIGGLRVEIEKAKEEYLKETNGENRAAVERVAELQKTIAQLQQDQLDAANDFRQISNDVKQMEADREELLKRFELLKEQKWNPDEERCPACGQSLPLDKINELRHNFLAGLAEKKREINESGKACSKEKIDAAKKAKDEADAKQNELAKKIASLEAEIKEAEAGIKQPPPYEETDDYKAKLDHLHEIEDKLQAETEAEDTSKEVAAIDERLKELREKDAAMMAAITIKDRIKELEADQAKLGQELDETDRRINMVESFYRHKVAMVTEKIDARFKNIKFLLFKEQLNGGIKEVCEPLVPDKAGNLIEYKSANTAAQVNAGLEIIQVLSEHYGAYLPVIIDRAESVTDLKPMPDHQVIRLAVSWQDKELKVFKGGI